MFHPRPLPAPDLEAQRLAWANEDAQRKARAFAEMYPGTLTRPAIVTDPSSFCRYCRGKGHHVDLPDAYGDPVAFTSCDTCGGTGWR